MSRRSSFSPILARFVLDAQAALLSAVEHVPPEFREAAPVGLSSAAWTVTHSVEAHQVWIGEYVGGRDRDRWFDAFRQDPTDTPAWHVAVEALERVMTESTAVLLTLGEPDLTRTGAMLPTSRFAGWTVSQLAARAISHLYIHAAELNTLTVLGGGDDLGLPGPLNNVRLAPA